MPPERTTFAVLAVPLAASALLLVACGSGDGGATVASSASAGAVAGAGSDDCAAGPPAADPLRNFKLGSNPDNDGVVGAIYNATTADLWTQLANAGAWCRIAPGARAAYTHEGDDSECYALVTQDPGMARYAPSAYGAACVEDQYFLPDPLAGLYVSNNGGSCRAPDSETAVPLNGTKSLSTAGVRVAFTRLNDDGGIARQWTGSDYGSVDDWARVDIRVEQLAPTSC